MFAGILVGLTIASIFAPPVRNTRMLPDPSNPHLVFKNPHAENGFFKIRCIEVPCTSEVDSLNLMSLLHK